MPHPSCCGKRASPKPKTVTITKAIKTVKKSVTATKKKVVTVTRTKFVTALTPKRRESSSLEETGKLSLKNSVSPAPFALSLSSEARSWAASFVPRLSKRSDLWQDVGRCCGKLLLPSPQAQDIHQDPSKGNPHDQENRQNYHTDQLQDDDCDVAETGGCRSWTRCTRTTLTSFSFCRLQTEQKISGQLFQDINKNGRYDVGIDRPYSFIQIQVRASRPLRLLQTRATGEVLAQGITDAEGSFTLTVSSADLARINTSSGGPGSVVIVLADSPDVPLQTIAITPDGVLEMLESGGAPVPVAVPPELVDQLQRVGPSTAHAQRLS